MARSALRRTESRGGHTRDDYPQMDANWRKVLLVCSATDREAPLPRIEVTTKEQKPMRDDLFALFELSELEKYYTDEELAEHPERTA